jgi:hypothetical protein
MVACILAGFSCSPARGDGGTVRYYDRLGDFCVSVFTSPTPLRVGPADVSVLIQDANTGEPVLDAQVALSAKLQNRPEVTLHVLATTTGATNKLLHVATLEFPEEGSWEVTLDLVSPKVEDQARLLLEVTEPLPLARAWNAWYWWPLAPITLFSAHQFLVHRRGYLRARGRLRVR